MSKRRNSLVALIVATTCSVVALWAQTAPVSPREIDNVAAFARLYGVVRFFYPGDAAASLDWDRFAIEGVAAVRTAADSRALASQLRTLFSPLGSGIDIAPTLTAFRPPPPSTEPLVAWRYLGPGVTAIGNSPYAAKRTNRARRVTATIDGFAGIAQAVPAAPLRGKAIRLRGMIRATAQNAASGGALWLRVDRAEGRGCFDNMGDRLVRDAGWREYFIQCAVADDATNIVFGAMAVGAATADFDGVEVSVPVGNGVWSTLPIKDAGFEAADGKGWGRVGSPDAQMTRLSEDAPEGRQFLRVTPGDRPVSTDELFPDSPPAITDHVDVELGAGLKARVALTLTDTQAKTAPPSSPAAASSDLDARLADIVVAWNIYRHFYPYFTEAGADWDARLRPQLQLAYQATTRSGEIDALRRLVADARDGHGRVNDLRQRAPSAVLPLQLALIESRVVVIASNTPEVAVGSVISSIDGAATIDRFTAIMQLLSGTPQWRQFGAAQEIVFCSNSLPVHLAFDNGQGPQTADVPCVASRPLETRPAQIAEIRPGVWYVDLTRVKTADLTPVIDTLAAAAGVIFDVRGYPTEAGLWLLPHLIDAPETDRWMHVAKITGPFGQSAGWRDEGWNLKPGAPKLAGKIVFLTDGRAISYAESVMGYIADRHLGTIVGGTTAGTNGDIASFTVPGGFSIVFTGLRVTGHDGRKAHHLVGVQPDIAVAPTIAGLRAGRDEVLARALSLLP